MAELEIKGIRKYYKKNRVLEDVSFSAEKGMCIGILGSNGSGKSTMLKILAGVLKPDQGSFLYQGREMIGRSQEEVNEIGYVPQGIPLIQELNGLDNLRLWYEEDALQKDLQEGFLAMLGIPEFLHTPVSKMSGGMQKRLSLGCALADRPKVLLLDEASAALDLVCKEKILSFFREYKREGGILIIATHDVQEIELCSQYYLLKDGILSPYDYDGNIHHLVGSL